ncbi:MULTISPECIES: TetR/AcrR family transcriptional regulator [Corallincola]|uniref:TetR/AcrR family transcriptional regulator n=3 Tax=Corallincola TaxID=1775176 RepID=A0A368NH67_9GAMM|nr:MULTISPECIES: TetR/AcrR family transcriptional regulator [Corallincola]RCU49526.1 TetR/AcrR family transcriptional regulator [Corallincola holothuriorum]TAA47821.1 TetR/AcrR family transcriptional regulator [Corallincola spongiicola]TCI02036.1 TetR/AcrR family transcriptional regulator [Corallincola luteus]
MPSTTQTILDAARDCFFRHGYSATNISMISRYAEISRVTIHKQFSNKEVLFREVCLRHHQEMQANLPSFKAQYKDTWSTLEAMLLDWAKPIFEEISDSVVLQDIVQAANKYCVDAMAAHIEVLSQFVGELLREGERTGQVDLSRCGLSELQLGSNLVLCAKGVFTTATTKQARETVSNMVKLYRAALT